MSLHDYANLSVSLSKRLEDLERRVEILERPQKEKPRKTKGRAR